MHCAGFWYYNVFLLLSVVCCYNCLICLGEDYTAFVRRLQLWDSFNKSFYVYKM